jgi:hypothetical protein
VLPFDELEDVSRAFALAAIELLIARNERREVRECKGENCGWLFLDQSKGGHRICARTPVAARGAGSLAFGRGPQGVSFTRASWVDLVEPKACRRD